MLYVFGYHHGLNVVVGVLVTVNGPSASTAMLLLVLLRLLLIPSP